MDRCTQLVPTKAVLFGLDVRFRAVEKKLEDEKSWHFKLIHLIFIERKNAFKTVNKKIMNDESGSKVLVNRHLIPQIDQSLISLENKSSESPKHPGKGIKDS